MPSKVKFTPSKFLQRASKNLNIPLAKRFKTFKSKSNRKYGQSGPEVKFLDTVVTVTGALSGPTAAGSTAPINSMAQGLTNITRVGNKIQILSVEYQGCAKVNAPYTEMAIGASWRWALVLDKEPEAGAIATYGAIYTSPIAATNQEIGFRVIDNSDRFVVLREGTIDSQPMQNAAGVIVAGTGDMYTNVKAYAKVNITTKFTGIGATQANMSTNQLLFIAACTTDDMDVQLVGACRIRYTDE